MQYHCHALTQTAGTVALNEITTFGFNRTPASGELAGLLASGCVLDSLTNCQSCSRHPANQHRYHDRQQQQQL